jgi:uncharacterized membrane protein YeaQ/YmgE (transglycosylase-associated protein family)
MKGNPALLGGSLKSKPTWLGTFGCLATSALFLRSSAMIAGAIGWIVLGLIAGYVASTLANRRREGLAFNIFLGVWGALTGGWIFNAAGATGVTGFSIWSLPVAAVGAVFALGVWHAIRRSVLRA